MTGSIRCISGGDDHPGRNPWATGSVAGGGLLQCMVVEGSGLARTVVDPVSGQTTILNGMLGLTCMKPATGAPPPVCDPITRGDNGAPVFTAQNIGAGRIPQAGGDVYVAGAVGIVSGEDTYANPQFIQGRGNSMVFADPLNRIVSVPDANGNRPTNANLWLAGQQELSLGVDSGFIRSGG